MANEKLSAAKKAKNDEFYTQYADIECEMNAYLDYDADTFRGKTVLLPCDDPEWSNFTRYFAQNFERLGLKKLISTSYAPNSKPKNVPYQLSLFESEDAQFDKKKTRANGKIFVLDEDTNRSGRIDIEDLKWHYLEGDGDFRSDEVKALRDEADIIVTNPPFSLFREFLMWIVEADKKFCIIGNQNAITYKESFPLIMKNKMWLGATGFGRDFVFEVPEGFEVDIRYKEKAARLGYSNGNYTRLGNTCWFTNLDHGRRHTPLALMTMEENLKFCRHKEIHEKGYLKYDNYDAIEVPYTDAIPSDYFEAPPPHPSPQTPQNGRSACLLPSSTSTVQSSLKSSAHPSQRDADSRQDCGMPPAASHNQSSMANESLSVSSSDSRCSGIMGVPITFLDKYCPEQFEIVGISKTWFNFANKTYPEQIQVSKDGKRQKVTKLNDGPVIKLVSPPENQTYYIVGEECYTQEYARIFIRRKV